MPALSPEESGEAAGSRRLAGRSPGRSAGPRSHGRPLRHRRRPARRRGAALHRPRSRATSPRPTRRTSGSSWTRSARRSTPITRSPVDLGDVRPIGRGGSGCSSRRPSSGRRDEEGRSEDVEGSGCPGRTSSCSSRGPAVRMAHAEDALAAVEVAVVRALDLGDDPLLAGIQCRTRRGASVLEPVAGDLGRHVGPVQVVGPILGLRRRKPPKPSKAAVRASALSRVARDTFHLRVGNRIPNSGSMTRDPDARRTESIFFRGAPARFSGSGRPDASGPMWTGQEDGAGRRDDR